MGRRDYRVLFTDGDGTLVRGKHLAAATREALRRLRASGRKAVLTTGESCEQLAEFPDLDLFDLIVAENGAVLCRPNRGEARVLAAPPPADFVRQLRRRGVEPLTVGQVIVSTRRSWEAVLKAVITELGMDGRLIANRKDVMALPAGVDKATGVAAALRELGLRPAEAVGVGDAENDVALLGACGFGVAVADSVPELCEAADLVTEGGPGRGVVELIERLLAGELPAPRRRAAHR